MSTSIHRPVAFLLPAALVLLLPACHRAGSGVVSSRTESYQVVGEGSTSGVSSTIAAPGEAPPSLTNTNADTTTNLSIVPNIATTTTTSTLPAAQPPFTIPGGTASPSTDPAPSPRIVIRRSTTPRTVAEPPPEPVTATSVPETKSSEPAETEAEEPPASDDTAPTDTVAPPPETAPTDTGTSPPR